MIIGEVDPETIDSLWVMQTCRNHPTLRWVRKNPARMIGMISRNPQIMFKGQANLNGVIIKTAMTAMPSPLHQLKCRLNGVNPFDSSLEDSEYTSWVQVVEFVEQIQELERRYAFECECPAGDLYTIGPSE